MIIAPPITVTMDTLDWAWMIGWIDAQLVNPKDRPPTLQLFRDRVSEAMQVNSRDAKQERRGA